MDTKSPSINQKKLKERRKFGEIAKNKSGEKVEKKADQLNLQKAYEFLITKIE